MQPSGNRPVYIVQPSNITHVNVRPTIITTGAQQLQSQQQPQPVYQLSTIRPPVISPSQQQTSSLYQVHGQPRLVSASPVYTTLPTTQRFATSPQTLLAGNANISPRLLTPQAARMPMNTVQTTTLLRPNVGIISSPTVTTSAPTSTAAAAAAATATATTAASSSSTPGAKEFSVCVPKTGAQYAIMEFASGLSIDVKDWKNIEMRREITSYNYRPPSNVDAASSSSSNTITTSLGVVLPKTGAGSEYGREQKEALKRKRYAGKGTNVEDLPWLLTDRSSSEKKIKQYRGLKRGSITANCSYYVFIQGKDGFEAYPVDDWYSFTPTNVYKTLDFEEAEKQYQERHKNLSKWFLNHQTTKEKSDGDEIENETSKKSTTKTRRDFKLLDAEDWVNEKDDDDDDDDQDDDDDGNSTNTKKSKNKKTGKKVKDGWTLSDDDDNDANESKTKKQKTTKQQKSDEHGGEDSDDGDHEGDEIEYTSDETSADEDDIKDVDTVKSAMKYEVKGVDEEMKNIPDIDKKIEEMDENADELDLDDEDEEFEIEDNDDENKTAADDLSDVSKLLKNDPLSKEIESSSDSDEMDDSDDPDKESIETINNSVNLQPIPSEQIKTEKGHKKAREEEMRAIKSKVMALPATPSNPSETITEEKVRALLFRRHYMTFTEIIQNFLPKAEHHRTKEIKDGIVQTLATIIKRLNIEEKVISGKKHIKLKQQS